MSANKSQNLKLHLWEPEDNFLRAEFNENFAAIDTAVKADRDAIKAEETARKSAVSSLQTSVNAKASTSALDTAKSELTTKINTAQSTADTAKTTANAAYCATNKCVAGGSFMTAGAGETNTVNVGFQPSFVFLHIGSLNFYALTGSTNSGDLKVTWKQNGFSWVVDRHIDGITKCGCMYIAVR